MQGRSIVFSTSRGVAAVLALVLCASGANAAGSWSALSISVPPGQAFKVVEATDQLMASEIGKQFPGRLLLQQSIADGTNPTTHTFVPIYKSAGAREAWFSKLQASEAYQVFLSALAAIGPGTSSARYRVLKSWGEISDTDSVWMSYYFDVEDPAAFVAAIDSFRSSATGKKSPSQSHLSSVVAAGITPTTHLVTVGYASEAEMENWQMGLSGNSDWEALLDALGDSADYYGATMARTVKVWGSASLESLVKP